MNRPFLELHLLVLNSDLLCWPHLVKKNKTLSRPFNNMLLHPSLTNYSCPLISCSPVSIMKWISISWRGSVNEAASVFVRAPLLDCFSMQIQDNCGWRRRDESQKAERGKPWRGEERRDDAAIREVATRRPSYTHRRHVHNKPSYRLIWGQKASILLPLHTTRLWHTFTGHVLFNTNGEGEIWVHVPVHVSLSLSLLFFNETKNKKQKTKYNASSWGHQTLWTKLSNCVDPGLLPSCCLKTNHLRRQPAAR